MMGIKVRYRLTLDDVVLGWCWFLVGAFFVSALSVFLQIVTRTPLRARVLKHLSLVVISLTATFYLAVALTFWHPDWFGHHFFYLRFLLWLTAIPTLLAALAHLGGLTPVNTFAICGFSVLYVVCLLVGYQASGVGKIVAVVFSVVFLVPVVHFSLEEFDRERTAGEFGKKASLAYQPLVSFSGAAMAAYVIVFVLADGVHLIRGAVELVMYSLIDITFLLGLSFRLSEVRPRHGSSPANSEAASAAYEVHTPMHGGGGNGYGSTGSIQV